MQCSRPLSTTNPEFSVLECSGYLEYKIENRRLVPGASGLTWFDAFIVATISGIWLKATHTWFFLAIIAFLFYVWRRCSQVLSESIILLPALGVQLETRRGFPLFSRPLFTSRRFIPLCALQDIIINEGLHRWNVRYYLVFANGKEPDTMELVVGYENLLPYHNVLVHVYRCLQSQIPNTARRGKKRCIRKNKIVANTRDMIY